jgi:hypothetical protein
MKPSYASRPSQTLNLKAGQSPGTVAYPARVDTSLHSLLPTSFQERNCSTSNASGKVHVCTPQMDKWALSKLKIFKCIDVRNPSLMPCVVNTSSDATKHPSGHITILKASKQFITSTSLTLQLREGETEGDVIEKEVDQPFKKETKEKKEGRDCRWQK